MRVCSVFVDGNGRRFVGRMAILDFLPKSVRRGHILHGVPQTTDRLSVYKCREAKFLVKGIKFNFEMYVFM